jgi:hypothetical protein
VTDAASGRGFHRRLQSRWRGGGLRVHCDRDHGTRLGLEDFKLNSLTDCGTIIATFITFFQVQVPRLPAESARVPPAAGRPARAVPGQWATAATARKCQLRWPGPLNWHSGSLRLRLTGATDSELALTVSESRLGPGDAKSRVLTVIFQSRWVLAAAI